MFSHVVSNENEFWDDAFSVEVSGMFDPIFHYKWMLTRG